MWLAIAPKSRETCLKLWFTLGDPLQSITNKFSVLLPKLSLFPLLNNFIKSAGFYTLTICRLLKSIEVESYLITIGHQSSTPIVRKQLLGLVYVLYTQLQNKLEPVWWAQRWTVLLHVLISPYIIRSINELRRYEERFRVARFFDASCARAIFLSGKFMTHTSRAFEIFCISPVFQPLSECVTNI